MNAFVWLLKREYWEHRGGFRTAPLVTAGILLGLVLMCLITTSLYAGKMHVSLGNIPIERLLSIMPEERVLAAQGLTLGLGIFSAFIQIPLTFVVFFYLLGALYDDRRDRSVLFWKSLPISDLQTVGSKLVSAALIAPLITFVVSVLMHLGVLILLSLFMLLHGINPLMLWWPTALLDLWAKLLVVIPLNALWAMPTYGWLLLISSYARNRPFLWAVAPLGGVGILNIWFKITHSFGLSGAWYARHIAGRLLGGIVPMGWYRNDGFPAIQHTSVEVWLENEHIPDILNWHAIGQGFASPNLWMGVLIGSTLLMAAVYVRRYRSESQN